MRITESQLRKIIRQEITRKVLKEAVDAKSIVDLITKDKIKDPNALKQALEGLGDDDGVKDAFSKSADEIKQAFTGVGGQEKDFDVIVKEIETGKSSVAGSLNTAVANAAKALGMPDLAQDLNSAITALKAGKDINSMSSSLLKPLAKLGAELIMGNAEATKAAGIALAKAGEKKI